MYLHTQKTFRHSFCIIMKQVTSQIYSFTSSIGHIYLGFETAHRCPVLLSVHFHNVHAPQLTMYEFHHTRSSEAKWANVPTTSPRLVPTMQIPRLCVRISPSVMWRASVTPALHTYLIYHINCWKALTLISKFGLKGSTVAVPRKTM